MKKLAVAISLLILLIVVVFSAGCFGTHTDDNKNTIIDTPTPTPTPRESYYANFELTIHEVYVGDDFFNKFEKDKKGKKYTDRVHLKEGETIYFVKFTCDCVYLSKEYTKKDFRNLYFDPRTEIYLVVDGTDYSRRSITLPKGYLAFGEMVLSTDKENRYGHFGTQTGSLIFIAPYSKDAYLRVTNCCYSNNPKIFS